MAREQILSRPSLFQRQWLSSQLRDETVGGILLLAMAVIALVWANSPWGDSYADLVNFQVGPESLGLNLSLGTWAADGLLAVFFFIAGLELKHEFVLGTLSKPAQAVVPIAAALGGMILPAAIFVVVNVTSADGAPSGWGIPMATDIAFALAVLAVVGRMLPLPLRAFLLALAVVDDLGAIIVIAIFYSHGFHLAWFLGAVALFVLYYFAQRQRLRTPWIYVPIAFFAWYCLFQSGVHATVAGVVLGLLTRVKVDSGEVSSPADRMSHLIHPISAGLCVPLFAFFASGVDLRSTGFLEALSNPIAIGVLVGLVIGKPLGVFGAAWITARFTRAELNPLLAWRDIATVGLLAGIGFTVALLISELAFPGAPSETSSAKVAVLTGSLISAVLATVAIRARNRHYRLVHAAETADLDGNGIPDVYEKDQEQ
jgi:NhaA family Na+:H+ antiporter